MNVSIISAYVCMYVCIYESDIVFIIHRVRSHAKPTWNHIKTGNDIKIFCNYMKMVYCYSNCNIRFKFAAIVLVIFLL